jgi:tripartite-type tricarboxylate transporter receptor subunit TctC
MKMISDPDVVRRLHAGGAEIVTSKSRDEFAGFLRNQTAFWAKIMKDTGATPD